MTVDLGALAREVISSKLLHAFASSHDDILLYPIYHFDPMTIVFSNFTLRYTSNLHFIIMISNLYFPNATTHSDSGKVTVELTEFSKLTFVLVAVFNKVSTKWLSNN